MREARLGGTSIKVGRFALAAGLVALLLGGFGEARAAQQQSARYLHDYTPAGPGGGEIYAMGTDGPSR